MICAHWLLMSSNGKYRTGALLSDVIRVLRSFNQHKINPWPDK